MFGAGQCDHLIAVVYSNGCRLQLFDHGVDYDCSEHNRAPREQSQCMVLQIASWRPQLHRLGGIPDHVHSSRGRRQNSQWAYAMTLYKRVHKDLVFLAEIFIKIHLHLNSIWDFYNLKCIHKSLSRSTYVCYFVKFSLFIVY